MNEDDRKIIQIMPAINWWVGFSDRDTNKMDYYAAAGFALFNDGSVEVLDACQDGTLDTISLTSNFHHLIYSAENLAKNSDHYTPLENVPNETP